MPITWMHSAFRRHPEYLVDEAVKEFGLGLSLSNTVREWFITIVEFTNPDLKTIELGPFPEFNAAVAAMQAQDKDQVERMTLLRTEVVAQWEPVKLIQPSKEIIT